MTHVIYESSIRTIKNKRTFYSKIKFKNFAAPTAAEQFDFFIFFVANFRLIEAEIIWAAPPLTSIDMDSVIRDSPTSQPTTKRSTKFDKILFP